MKSSYIICIIFLFLIFNSSYGQKSSKKFTINGVVLDANQKPVGDAIILIDNQKTNAVTDEKGVYKIRVYPKAKLISVFSFRNGVSEAEIGGRTVINFKLKASASSIKTEVVNPQNEETVNVGYGTTRKKEMTTETRKIDGTNKKYAAYQNIYDMIRGEFPGVQVTGKNIQIQGPSSFNLSSDPLLVVNGMAVVSIDDISPLQVKSIEILKGSAAAIYGSRGTNGVILIYLLGAPEIKK
jgi:TonB-dependent SusC/RagA subfamily outer membrane receptor